MYPEGYDRAEVTLEQMATPCIEWTGAKTGSGYGSINIDGKSVSVHRWAVAQVDGWEAIDGMVVMHLCDNRLCFRYDHLRIGTQADNVIDCRDKGRNAVFFGEAHGQSKITEEDVQAMRRRRDAGESFVSIAADYPIGRQAVSKICRRVRWPHVTDVAS